MVEIVYAMKQSRDSRKGTGDPPRAGEKRSGKQSRDSRKAHRCPGYTGRPGPGSNQEIVERINGFRSATAPTSLAGSNQEIVESKK